MTAMRQLTTKTMMVAAAALAVLAPQLPGQAAAGRGPHIGYVFPAGAQRGTTVEMLIGGQYLRNTSQVVVSGPDVTARLLKVYRPPRNLDKDQRQEIQRQIFARRAVLAGRPVPPVKPRPADAPAFEMPELPLLDRLPRADLAELEHLVQLFMRTSKKQMNAQLGEMVTLEITVAATAAPGQRELRLLTPLGLTNPLRFEVGAFGEVCEREPNDPKPGVAPPPQIAGLPAAFNGQVFPGDVDRLRFHARSGQSLVVEVQARALIPYLADAVPGWFQPVLSVFDPQGKELAYADDFRFRPDPVLLFRVPADGDYSLEIRDSIFRGREDFIYRIKVSEQPFVTACFPLGAAAASTATGRLAGWNLPQPTVVLDTRPGAGSVREFTVAGHGMVSNPVAYAVDELPDAAENEPNNDRSQARVLPWPCVVNGRIQQPGDADVFRLAAPAKTNVLVEVWARRLGSPLDSVVKVSNAAGVVLAWNDDSMPKDGELQLGDGLLTHHADSRLAVSLPDSGGPFFVQVEDTQHQGGEAFAYRLRVAPATPDFALRVTPSAINLAPGQVVPVTVHVDRRGGFSGAVTLALDGVPTGWTLSGNVIPPGRERLRMTVQAPPNAAAGVVPLRLTGNASPGGSAISRVAEPCDDTMQAFLWRHLVPATEFLAAVMPGKTRGPMARRLDAGNVNIPSGGEAVVRYQVPPWVALQGGKMVAVEAPDGLTVTAEPGSAGEVAVHLSADAAKLKPGETDNLILGIQLAQVAQAAKLTKQARANRGATPIVVLPALPLTIKPKSSTP